jgi:hypothetical protein
MLQPQIADKATALQRLLGYHLGHHNLISQIEWDLEDAVSAINYYGGWKPFDMARSGTFKPPEEVNPFIGYNYETFGFTALVAEILGGNGSWSLFGYRETSEGLNRSDILKIRKDYDECQSLVYKQSRLVNFATYAGAKMWCEADDGATTCEIDNTATIPRNLIDRESGELFYPKGAKFGYKLIVSTWIDKFGNLSIRWAKSYPVYSNPEAFELVASC